MLFCWNSLNSSTSINHNSKPFPKRQILASKMKVFADDNFKFDENVRMFCKRVENTVGKGEIARKEQFLFFPKCFLPFRRTFCSIHQIWNCHLQTLSICKSLLFVIWERVKLLVSVKVMMGVLTLSQTSPCFYVSAVQAFWKHWGKRRNYSEGAISPFPTLVFHLCRKLSAIFIKFDIVVCKLFQFGRV